MIAVNNPTTARRSASRSTRRTSAAFRAAMPKRPKPTHAAVIRAPWGAVEIVNRGSHEEMMKEAKTWNRCKGYRCTVKPLAEAIERLAAVIA
jgi:hypothetical protein